MGIDLFTLVAQIINLIILLWLLRKFLYVPLLNAVTARQKLIAEELQNAADSKERAQKSEIKYLQKLSGLEKEKQSILAKVHQEAEIVAIKLKNDAEKQYQNAKEQWQTRLKAQQRSFDIVVQKMTAEYFGLFADKAIREILGSDSDDMAIAQLMHKIVQLPTEQKENLQLIMQNKSTIYVTTAHFLNNTQRDKITKFLRQELGLSANTEFIYKNDAELIAGITLQVDEQLIDWSMQSYLQEFQQNMHKEISYLLSRSEK